MSSRLEPQNHPYVLGATNLECGSFIDALEAGYKKGQDYLSIKAEWKTEAELKTFDEAVQAAGTTQQYETYTSEVQGKILSLQQRRQIAKEALDGMDIAFNWELPRLPSGQYMWQWSTPQVIDRAVLAAPLGDVTWSRQDKPSKYRGTLASLQES